MDRECELDLVRRVREGDLDAFDTVYGVFNARLFAFLARLTRNRDLAEDLLEETWLRLVRHAHLLDADTRLGPWLFAVARNLYVSYCRSRALEDASLSDPSDMWPVSPVDSPFEQTAASELERRIEAALASMPLILREVLLLVGIEGLRPMEAAQVCGVSPETLRQRLKRARDLMAERLETSERPPIAARTRCTNEI